MAQFTVNATRFDPYKNFKFRVKWDGHYVAGVSKVGGLKRTTEVVKRTRSASELVTVWERGIGLLPIERALVLLASARPDLPLAALPHITVGQRDGELLTLREANFGSQMTAVVTCPDCGTDLELT